MKSILLLIALLAISSARNRRLISYEEHVRRGGLPLPQAIRDADPGWWYRHQLEDRNVSTNIVGGRDANDGEIPYIYSLRRTSHSCGGSILTERTLITAAHCVSGASPAALSIRYNSLLHASGGVLLTISSFIVHENYNSGTIDSDIALLYTSAALVLGQTQAQAISLVAQGNDPAAGQINTVSGWGTTSESGSLSATLKTVDIPTVSRADCNSQYGSGSITQTMYCAGISAGGIDACQGDSGGPYVINGLLAGLTSWGYGCARPTHAGVATRVGSFVDWINARLQ
jgi:trypsin